jgi:hypothetical protein
MDHNRLAALLDGTLRGADREAAISELAALNDDDLGVYAEAIAVLRDHEAIDSAAGGARPPRWALSDWLRHWLRRWRGADRGRPPSAGAGGQISGEMEPGEES